jgi:hypothetical protein
MLCAAAVSAEFVSGKATRDALFLTSLDFAALPTMLIATSACSILLVAAHGRSSRRIAPALLVPGLFALSGLLFLAEWLARSMAPAATAVSVYLHISGAGPLLASGFWLIASERFDPRTAKTRFGQIAGAGTLGGLLGALLAERVAAMSGAPTMLLFLAALQFLTAGLVRILASQIGPVRRPASDEDLASAPPRSGLRTVADAPHLRQLAALVLLGTTSAALLEYLFKAKAVETLGPGDHLLRFFAFYYAATSLITFILQALLSRTVLERFGLALTTSTPSIALLAGSLGGLIAPGFGSLLVARSGESIFRGSWFRAGYELFYTPLPAAEKRAAKSVIDVAFDRMGDAVGGALVRLSVVLVPVAQSSAILSLAMASSVGAIFAASRLNHWYVRSLENSLVEQGSGIDRSAADDDSTREVLIRMRGTAFSAVTAVNTRQSTSTATVARAALDLEMWDILALRSRNRARIIQVLSREEGIPAALVPHTIPLLAAKSTADYAFFALRKVAEERIGQLTDALLDPNQDDAVRSRLARVLSVGVSQRAVDALMLALDDAKPEVRLQAARSLAAILEKNPRVLIDRERIYGAALREVRDRAGQSLDQVFVLLGLVLPTEPLQIAFRSLHADDPYLRGTALEYLEEVLPAPIRQRLWPYLVDRPVGASVPVRGEMISKVLRFKASSGPNVTANRHDAQQIAGLGIG